MAYPGGDIRVPFYGQRLRGGSGSAGLAPIICLHMSTPSRPTAPAVPARGREELAAPATQIVRDRDAYLGQSRDVGRRLTDDQYEFFVGGDPAQALQREFERLTPHYIALHDVGTSSSLRLLTAMAATTDAKVMRLSVRRQGHGVALATLQFVEIIASDGTTIRAYSTDIDSDSHSRHEMARVLMSRATLGVIVFGDLPQHALRPALQPLLDSIDIANPWRTRELLLVPMGAPAMLSPFAAGFVGRGVHTRVASQSPRPNDAWAQIGAAWHRLHHGAAPATPADSGPPPKEVEGNEEPTQPMGLRDVTARPMMPVAAWSDYVLRVASIKGMVSCCVFDRGSGRVLAHAGGRPSAEMLQALGERLLVTASEVGAMLGTGADIHDLEISFAGHHVLLRALPPHRGVVLHAVLDAVHGNLAIARAQLQRLDPK